MASTGAIHPPLSTAATALSGAVTEGGVSQTSAREAPDTDEQSSGGPSSPILTRAARSQISTAVSFEGGRAAGSAAAPTRSIDQESALSAAAGEAGLGILEEDLLYPSAANGSVVQQQAAYSQQLQTALSLLMQATSRGPPIVNQVSAELASRFVLPAVSVADVPAPGFSHGQPAHSIIMNNQQQNLQEVLEDNDRQAQTASHMPAGQGNEGWQEGDGVAAASECIGPETTPSRARGGHPGTANAATSTHSKQGDAAHATASVLATVMSEDRASESSSDVSSIDGGAMHPSGNTGGTGDAEVVSHPCADSHAASPHIPRSMQHKRQRADDNQGRPPCVPICAEPRDSSMAMMTAGGGQSHRSGSVSGEGGAHSGTVDMGGPEESGPAHSEPANNAAETSTGHNHPHQHQRANQQQGARAELRSDGVSRVLPGEHHHHHAVQNLPDVASWQGPPADDGRRGLPDMATSRMGPTSHGAFSRAPAKQLHQEACTSAAAAGCSTSRKLPRHAMTGRRRPLDAQQSPPHVNHAWRGGGHQAGGSMREGSVATSPLPPRAPAGGAAGPVPGTSSANRAPSERGAREWSHMAMSQPAMPLFHPSPPTLESRGAGEAAGDAGGDGECSRDRGDAGSGEAATHGPPAGQQADAKSTVTSPARPGIASGSGSRRKREVKRQRGSNSHPLHHQTDFGTCSSSRQSD